MRVDLAAQVLASYMQCSIVHDACIPFCYSLIMVLSNSVSKALTLYGGPQVEETAILADHFNKFFDCLNVSSIDEGKKKRNEFKVPYRSNKDFRLQVIYRLAIIILTLSTIS